MVESRRHLLSILGAAVGMVSAGSLAPALFGQAPQPRPSANAPKNENAPMGLENAPSGQQPTPGEANRQLQATIRKEVDSLCAMANELREDMLHINPGATLSLVFVKKAQAIEKLAKQIKDQAKG